MPLTSTFPATGRLRAEPGPGPEPERAAAEPALALLPSLRRQFDRVAAALAADCTIAGQLQPDRLDLRQVACFELAWAGAELLATETALDAAAEASGGTGPERRLALLFGADAVAALLSRLELIALDLGLDLAPIQSLAASAAWAAWRRDALGAQALNSTGRAVADAEGDSGPALPDGPLAMAQAAFRRFAAEVVAPQVEAIHRHDLTVPEALLGPMRAMGVFGLSIPERFGGSAPDDRDDPLMMVVVTEALSEASLAAAGSLITRPEILSRALLAGGTPAQQARWLPALAAGEPLCAIAITEPDFGSDVAALALRATPVPGGWRLDGAKTWCTFAGKAGLLMVVARTDPDGALGHKGLSLLLVEKPVFEGHQFEVQQPEGGRLVGRAIATIGYRGMHSFDLSFDGFFVPGSHLVGGEAGLGRGFHLTMAGMAGGRLQTAARACGVMRAALRASLRYATDRRVFGRPLLEQPLTLAKLARMAARLSACRQLAFAVARRMDAGGARLEPSLVKLLACRSAEIVTREALQLHGGMGYAEESAVSRYFVDARVLSIFEGAEETLALKVVARGLLEAALAR